MHVQNQCIYDCGGAQWRREMREALRGGVCTVDMSKINATVMCACGGVGAAHVACTEAVAVAARG